MSIIADITRPFWLNGLNKVTGPQSKGIGGLICDEEYQSYTQMSSGSFAISFAEPESLLCAFAADINRIASASFESILSVRKTNELPKSSAWLVVQTYYSAFFSAHAFIRLLGESCTVIERVQVNSLTCVGNLFSTAPPSAMSSGLYHLVYDATTKTLTGQHIGGSHETFWKVFHDRMVRLSNDATSVATQTAANRLLAHGKLTELTRNLCHQSAPTGNWLSSFRNAVNYSQRHATWYPYYGRKKYYEQLHENIQEWRKDPFDIDINYHEEKDIRRFQATCNFLIASMKSIIEDMADRCNEGRSFHNYGALSCLNVAGRKQLC